MEEMRDSSASVADGDALRAAIRADGYVLLRGLVDPGSVGRVAEDGARVLADRGWASGGVATRLPSKAAEDDDYWSTYAALLSLESFNALGCHPALREVMATIAGPRVWGYPAKTARLVFPDEVGGRPIPIHRDNRGGPWIQDMFTTWVALGDVPLELGGLAVLRGSQTYRYAAIREQAGGYVETGGEPVPGDESPEWVTTHFRPGDVVVFHCYTLHKGMPNRTRGIRFTADYRWQTDDHPAHVSVLMPYHYFDQYPRIPGWDTMTREWSTPDWCAFPDTVEVVYKKWPWGDDRSVPPSQFVDVVPGALEEWRPATRNEEMFRLPHVLPPVRAVR